MRAAASAEPSVPGKAAGEKEQSLNITLTDSRSRPINAPEKWGLGLLPLAGLVAVGIFALSQIVGKDIAVGLKEPLGVGVVANICPQRYRWVASRSGEDQVRLIWVEDRTLIGQSRR